MKYVKLILAIFTILSFFAVGGCGGGGGGTPSSPTLQSITISGASTTLQVGVPETLAATGHYSDGSTKDITTSAAWSSSNPTAATVNSTGTVTTLAAGSTKITAAVGAITGFVNLTVTSAPTAEANVMQLTVNGSTCDPTTSGGYFNKPCVSVTVCTPDQSVCKTFNDILLDTGSYGLRIFKSALDANNIVLPQPTPGLAECIPFLDGSSLWGPIETASVQLGTEVPVQMPIQVIDASFAPSRSQCTSADATPVAAGFTGILGIGVSTEDCGDTCANSSNNTYYYSCNGSNCAGTTVPILNQVKNPASQLLQDNNGLIVQLPAVSTSGAPSTSGSLILGIGTKVNNTLTPSPGIFPTDVDGNFTTTFNGFVFSPASSLGASFLDTGSNAYFFPDVDTTLPVLTMSTSSGNAYWYNPTSLQPLTATIAGASGSPSQNVSFYVGNFSSLTSSSNSVFNDIAGPLNPPPSHVGDFDWGLPFFFGKNVYVGFQGASGLGTQGPFVGFVSQ